MDLNQERALFEKAQASSAGFGELFDAYYDRIYAYAFRRVGSTEAAEDIAACVFEDALRGIKRFKWKSKPPVAWLFRIASRRVADYYRLHSGTATLSDGLTEARDGPEAVAEGEEERDDLRSALAQLSKRDREVIRLAFFEELDGAEVAAICGCSRNSAYVRLHRALRRLRAVLTSEVQDERAE